MSLLDTTKYKDILGNLITDCVFQILSGWQKKNVPNLKHGKEKGLI